MNEIEAALILSRKPTVGAAKFKQLLTDHLSPSNALDTFIKSNVEDSDKAPLDIPAAITYLEKNKNTNITWINKTNYPTKLSMISEPPPVLFFEDSNNLLEKSNSSLTVGIVGSRKATPTGIKLTEEITKKLIEKDCIIVSGLAEGIDSISHNTCLNHGGKTIGVIANGIDVVYPKSNEDLFKKMRAKACICTEFFPSAPPKSSYFPTRNRIIAGLCDVIIMIEGKANSGALYTVKNALKTHRKCYVPNFNNFELMKYGLINAIELGAENFDSTQNLLNQISKIQKKENIPSHE